MTMATKTMILSNPSRLLRPSSTRLIELSLFMAKRPWAWVHRHSWRVLLHHDKRFSAPDPNRLAHSVRSPERSRLRCAFEECLSRKVDIRTTHLRFPARLQTKVASKNDLAAWLCQTHLSEVLFPRRSSHVRQPPAKPRTILSKRTMMMRTRRRELQSRLPKQRLKEKAQQRRHHLSTTSWNVVRLQTITTATTALQSRRIPVEVS